VTDDQRLLAAIVESSEDAILSSTPAGVISTWNRGAEAIFGYKAAETIGQHVSMLMAPGRLEEVKYFVGQILQGTPVSQYQSLCRRKDGRSFPVSVSGSPLIGSAGEVKALSAILRDMSKQKDADDAIRESDERFRIMADGCPAVMWVTDAAGEIQFINRAYRELFGTTYEETAGHKWQIVLHPEDSAEYLDALQCALRDHTPLHAEARARRADGEWRCMSSYGEPRFSTDGVYLGLVGLSLDITERKSAEARLSGVTELLRLAALAGGVGVWDYDVVNNVIVWDEQMFRLYGITRENFGGAYEAWQAGVHPDDRKRSNDEIQLALQSEHDFNTEFRVVWPDGSIHHIRARSVVQRDASGKPLHMIGTNWDITAEKLANERASALAATVSAREARLRAENEARVRSSKLEAVGTLAAGVAHDFNNILASIVGYAELTADTLPEGSEAQHNIAQILAASFRARDLITRMLTFARKGAVNPVPVDMVLQVREALALLRASLDPSIELSFCSTLKPASSMILADPTQITQILMNLCINAAQAMNNHGVVRISLDPAAAIADAPLEFRTGICLVVADEGCGMTPSVAERIFDPFFTTKAPGAGTGLGLSVVYGIVTELGGVITVQSRVKGGEGGKGGDGGEGGDQGTVFRVFLPLARTVTMN
jgi:PAS domain S-box-containing protein